MESHVDELVALFSLKKDEKREPNSLERKQFEASWTALVNECGFNTEAESFLYDGYTYCGAAPFYTYMKNAQSQTEALSELYRGKKYGEHCIKTSSVLIHLLALSLNDPHRDIRVVVSLVQHIPSVLKNKEGKLYGQADRTFKNYFFDKLMPNITFPNMSDMLKTGLNETSLREFSDVLGELVGKMDTSRFGKKCQRSIQNVDIWLKSSIEQQPEETEAVSSEAEQEKAPETNMQTEIPQAELEKLKSERDAFEQSAHEAMDKLHELTLVNERQNAEIAKLNRTLTDKDEAIADLRERLRICENEIAALRNLMMAADKKADALAADVSKRDELIEMLRRDRSHQSDESTKRLASKLRYLYVDYTDAKALTMSEDLGENMREQLGEVFKILIESGMKF